MGKPPKYRVVVGEEKRINAALISAATETHERPILMSAVANASVPNGVVLCIVFETTD
jgi:hypothetical protein